MGGVEGGYHETLGSRSEVPCLHFTLASSFKRNFELVVKVIPPPGHLLYFFVYTLLWLLVLREILSLLLRLYLHQDTFSIFLSKPGSIHKFVQSFAITARRVTLHAFKVLQRSAQSLFKIS